MRSYTELCGTNTNNWVVHTKRTAFRSHDIRDHFRKKEEEERFESGGIEQKCDVIKYNQSIAKKELTPSPTMENCELLNVTMPVWCWSEKRSDQKTKYNDIAVMKIAWIVDIPLPNLGHWSSVHLK